MNVFHKAADLLEMEGWCQNKSYDSDGRRCAGLALAVAGGGGHAYWDFERSLGYPNSISAWNDTPGRTKEEVIAKLREFGDTYYKENDGQSGT